MLVSQYASRLGYWGLRFWGTLAAPPKPQRPQHEEGGGLEPRKGEDFTFGMNEWASAIITNKGKNAAPSSVFPEVDSCMSRNVEAFRATRERSATWKYLTDSSANISNFSPGGGQIGEPRALFRPLPDSFKYATLVPQISLTPTPTQRHMPKEQIAPNFRQKTNRWKKVPLFYRRLCD